MLLGCLGSKAFVFNLPGEVPGVICAAVGLVLRLSRRLWTKAVTNSISSRLRLQRPGCAEFWPRVLHFFSLLSSRFVLFSRRPVKQSLEVV